MLCDLEDAAPRRKIKDRASEMVASSASSKCWVRVNWLVTEKCAGSRSTRGHDFNAWVLSAIGAVNPLLERQLRTGITQSS